VISSSATLGELLRIKHGFAFKGEFFNDAGDALLLTPGNFKIGGGLQVRPGKERYYSGTYPSEFLLQGGDLLIAMTDLTQGAPILGSPIIIPTEGSYLHNQRLGKVIDLDESRLDRGYAYYLFVSDVVRAQLRGSATGSTVRHTAPERIYRAVVPLPPLSTQRKIASVLSAYDDLIGNNHRRAVLLEEMAQRIYREWFVEFRYPGHAGVPLVESDPGPVPLGWPVVNSSSAITINPKVEIPKNDPVPFVPMGSLSESTSHISATERRLNPGGSRFLNADTLFARITPCLENGKTAYVQILEDGQAGAGSTEFIVLRSRLLTPEYVYLLARSDSFRAHAIKSMSGASGRQRVRREAFDSYSLAVPPSDLLDAFQSLVRPMLRTSYVLSIENERLRHARDLLLPRLISGEIDVERLDISIEEAAA
jgi:type I restriction enzyme S subunit